MAIENLYNATSVEGIYESMFCFRSIQQFLPNIFYFLMQCLPYCLQYKPNRFVAEKSKIFLKHIKIV